MVGLVVLSAASPLVQAAVTAHLQSFVDPAMMGRVFGFMGSMYAGLMSLGSLLFGLLADGAPAWDASYVVRGCGCAVRRDVSAANDFFASTGSGLLQMRALPITARSIACAN